MIKGLTIRAPTIKDANALSIFAIKTFILTYHMVSDADIKYYTDLYYTEEVFISLMNDEKHGIWIAMIPNNNVTNVTTGESEIMIGFCLSGPTTIPTISNSCGELKKLYIDVPFFGTGLSSTLFEMGIAWLRIHFNSHPIYISVHASNLKAQKFYQKYKFELVDRYLYSSDENNIGFIYKETDSSAGLPILRIGSKFADSKSM